jgi:hypothetical protein
VTTELGGGKYLVEGVKFNMSGWWELSFTINDERHKDDVSFNVVVN